MLSPIGSRVTCTRDREAAAIVEAWASTTREEGAHHAR